MVRPILSIAAILSCVSGSALALEPPTGWTKVDDSTAVLNAERPEYGELREFTVTGGTGDPDEIVLSLKSVGVVVESHLPDNQGAVNLAIQGRLARARHVVVGDGTTWMVVMVAPEHAATLDPDAVLLAALPRPSGGEWGLEQAQPLSGWTDGSVWGADKPAAAESWVTEGAMDPWAQDATVVGIWEGTAILAGIPTNLRFRFENTGAVILERTPRKKKAEVLEGSWATRKGLMKLGVDGGGDALGYSALGSTLTIEYAGAQVTLYKKQG